MHSYPEPIDGEKLFTTEGMENSQVAFHTHDHHDEDRCSVAESIDELIHLAQEFSKDPAANQKK